MSIRVAYYRFRSVCTVIGPLGNAIFENILSQSGQNVRNYKKRGSEVYECEC
jgi:hypothetical protein